MLTHFFHFLFDRYYLGQCRGWRPETGFSLFMLCIGRRAAFVSVLQAHNCQSSSLVTLCGFSGLIFVGWERNMDMDIEASTSALLVLTANPFHPTGPIHPIHSIHPSTHPSNPFIHPSIPSIHPIHSSIHPFHSSIHPSIHSFIHPSIHPSNPCPWTWPSMTCANILAPVPITRNCWVMHFWPPKLTFSFINLIFLKQLKVTFWVSFTWNESKCYLAIALRF